MARVDLDPEGAARQLDPLFVSRLGLIGSLSVVRMAQHVPVATGATAASLRFQVDPKNLVVRFGSPLLRARFIELGTIHMGPRSFVRRTADELLLDYARIIARGR